MNTKQVAGLTGISVRTLHYYDKIGLLCPGRNDENGYRQYVEADLDLLQQILFFKKCGFSLSKIRALIKSPSFDRKQAFILQRKYLQHEKRRIDTMLATLDKSLKAMKGEYDMAQNEKFKGLDFDNNPYEDEARRLWGDQAVDNSKKHIGSLSDEEKSAVAKGMDDLFCSLAKLRLQDPASDAVQAAMDGMYRYFNQNFGVTYSLQAFAGLGQMYVTDSRFTENIDKYGAGLSEFLAAAMGIYAKNKAK